MSGECDSLSESIVYNVYNIRFGDLSLLGLPIKHHIRVSIEAREHGDMINESFMLRKEEKTLQCDLVS